MPTAATTTFSAAARIDPLLSPDRVICLNVAIVPSVTLVKGTVLGEVTATPGTYKAYAAANTDGSQVAKGILEFSISTDASGNITLAGEFGQTTKNIPMVLPTRNVWASQNITGLDAAGLANLGGVLSQGTLLTGVVCI